MAERARYNTEKVLEIYAQGALQIHDISREEMGEILGLTLTQTRSAFLSLRNRGYLPPFDPEDIHKPKTESHNDKVSEAQAQKWKIVRPFLARQLLPLEAEMITGMPRRSIISLSHHKRRFGQVEDYAEFTEERRKRGSKMGAARRHKKEVSKHDRLGLEFIKKLYEQGKFSADLTYWNALKNLYALHQRALPESRWDMLRLEIFMQARSELVENSNFGPLRSYVETGAAIGQEWFDKSLEGEENFISGNYVIMRGYDGEDEKGLFVVRDGKKWYQLGESQESGKVALDNSVLVSKRRMFREKQQS